jgi:hypothetical protein
MSACRTRICLIALSGLLLCASMLTADVVVFKNGSQLSCKGFTVVGDKVVLTLPNGNEVSYKTSDVDFSKTDELNKLGKQTNVRVLEGREARNLMENEQIGRPSDEKRFNELISTRTLALPEPQTRNAGSSTTAGPILTPAGFLNLASLPKRPFDDVQVGAELLSNLRSQGFEAVRVYQGSKSKRALAEIFVASEASVFKAMKDTANALIQIDQRFPKKVEAIELLLLGEGGVLAGQFTLTPELAGQLVSGRIEPNAFFVRFVEF